MATNAAFDTARDVRRQRLQEAQARWAWALATARIRSTDPISLKHHTVDITHADDVKSACVLLFPSDLTRPAACLPHRDLRYHGLSYLRRAA